MLKETVADVYYKNQVLSMFGREGQTKKAVPL
jgi:hypothetical protein